MYYSFFSFFFFLIFGEGGGGIISFCFCPTHHEYGNNLGRIVMILSLASIKKDLKKVKHNANVYTVTIEATRKRIKRQNVTENGEKKELEKNVSVGLQTFFLVMSL